MDYGKGKQSIRLCICHYRWEVSLLRRLRERSFSARLVTSHGLHSDAESPDAQNGER